MNGQAMFANSTRWSNVTSFFLVICRMMIDYLNV